MSCQESSRKLQAQISSVPLIFYRGYKYLYYRIYAWNLRTWGESDLPQYNALFGVSFLIFLNIMSFLTAIEVCTGRRFTLSRLAVIAMGGTLMVTGYLLLVHNGKYRRIAKEFSDESPTQRKRRLIAAVIYVTLTFATFFSLVSIRNS